MIYLLCIFSINNIIYYQIQQHEQNANTSRKANAVTNNLLKLRKAAGYCSANDFAKAHGISPSTYARYESDPSKISVECAWRLADVLRCSIDLIVGRENINTPNLEGIQSRYNALSADGRALVDSYLSYVELGECAARSTLAPVHGIK